MLKQIVTSLAKLDSVCGLWGCAVKYEAWYNKHSWRNLINLSSKKTHSKNAETKQKIDIKVLSKQETMG